MLKIKDLINTKSSSFPWLVLGAVYILLSVFITGMARWEFSYGILYSLSFLSIAFLLASQKPSLLAGLMTAVAGTIVVFVQMSQVAIYPGLILTIIAFVVLLANEFGVLKWKANRDVKYLSFVPFFLMLAYACYYFYGRITLSMPLPPATLLSHGGIAVLALDGILRMSGASKKQWLTWIGLLATLIGAVWLTLGLGWGLQLTG